MTIRNSKIEEQDWNRFVLEQNGSFLQSWEWGEFQENFGRRVFRFSSRHPELDSGSKKPVTETLKQVQGDSIAWVAQFIEMPLPLGKKYWYGPRGPIIKSNIKNPRPRPIRQLADEGGQISKILEEFVQLIEEAAKKEGIMFFRIGPEWPADIELEAKLEIIGFKKLRYDIEPSQTLILDITKSEDELLAQMHSKWRYNIGLAQKKGITVKIIDGQNPDFEKYFADFWRLMEQTARRQKIRLHDRSYYKKQLLFNAQNPPQPSPSASSGQALKGGSKSSPPLGGVRGDFKNLLFVVEHQGQVIAVNIVNFFLPSKAFLPAEALAKAGAKGGGRATYLHGGWDKDHRSLMAPHLLQWEQIREAKRRGCVEYDFWGINEKKWPGVTRFKKGFGGREVKYIGTWDYPLDKKWYLVYRGVQKFRR